MLLPIIFAAAASAAPPAAPTYQELMDPSMFPEPQRGMEVESVEVRDDGIRVLTTGADIRLRASQGEVSFGQRIGHERAVASLTTGVPWQGAEVTHEGPGLARITFEEPRATVRINGDSLFMLHVHEPLTVSVERRIEPAYNATYRTHHLIADEWGAFGVYCSETGIDSHFDPYEETVASYDLPEDAVLWVGVCPPKAYDWERSFDDNVVWHWSNTLGYPPDDVLESWEPLGNIVLLQSEVMLWRDWNLDFVPRLGPEEFARVRETLHDQGMRFIVYTSPYYFLKATSLEDRALNSFEDFQGWPPGTGTGENMGLFMDAITRVMEQHMPDGLYFDGQYTGNPAALYALARSTRELLGENGILEWHSTGALGSGGCYLPHADAYVDFVLRGEGRAAQYADMDYLRFFVSGYNVSNSMGVLCNNSAEGRPTPDLTRRLLSVNGRYHTIAGWENSPDVMKVIEEDYQPRLTAALQAEVDAGCERRQAEVGAKADAARAERAALKAEPEWGEPLLAVEFDEMPEAESLISEHNPDPFTVADGALTVRGAGNTHAFLKLPLEGAVQGFTVRMRLGSDAGQSWGPGVCLVLGSGAKVRIGLRSDGLLQSDILGSQRIGASHQTDKDGEWIWLRVRWLGTVGVFEHSPDGETWERAWTFEHGGALNSDAAALLIGKVPYNGEPQDYSVPGDVGECQFESVQVYPR